MEVLKSKIEFQKHLEYKRAGMDSSVKIPSHWKLLSNKYIFKLKKFQVGKKSASFKLLSLTLKGVIQRDLDGGGKFPAEFDTYQEVKIHDFIFCLFDVEETPRCVGLSSYDGMITGAYTVMEAAPSFDKQFLYFFYLNLDSDKRLKSLYTGLRNTISKDNFFGYKTFVPPLSEQTAIANFLDDKTSKIDKAIAQKEKMIDLLKERKQIMIQNAVTKGLDPKVKMKDSGVEWIGEIPEHWEVKKLKFLALIRSGQVNPLILPFKEMILVAPNHLESCTGRIIYTETADQQGADSGKYFSFKGDIIYSKIRPELRKVCIATDNCLCSADMYAIKPSSIINSEYLLLVFLGEQFNAFMINQSMRVAMPKVNRNDVLNYPIIFPTIKEQNEIVANIKSKALKIDRAIESQQSQIKKLKEYKATLIDSAVTGKIKVS